MPEVRMLGSVNLLDATMYRVPVASEGENKIYEVRANPILNSTLINLGMADHVATELTMDVWVTGTSWATMLTNYAAIQSALDAAAAYSISGAGSAITYQEQVADQGSPTVYTVKWGKLTEDRTRRLEARIRRVGKLYLYCLPHD